MILSSGYQARLFLTTIAIGALLGFTYDIFRIFRKIVPHSNFFLQIEDAIYWVMVILTMFMFMLHENYGEIRFFSIIGAFLGMVLYFLTLSRVVILVSSTVIDIIKRILLLFLTIVLTPFRLVWLLLRKPVIKTEKMIRKKSKSLLHSMKVCVKIKNRKLKQSLKRMKKK